MAEYILQQVLNGLCQGSIYALFAIGYTLIVGVIGLVSFTHGEVIMIGAYAAFFIAPLMGNNIIVGLLAGFVISGLLGIVIHRICYVHFLDAPRHIPLLCTIGMSMLLKNLVQIWASSETLGMPELMGNGYVALVGDIRINYVQITVIVVVIALSILLSLFLNQTKQGIMLRAVSQDRKAAALVGISVSKATLIGNIIGCGIGGISGVLYALYYSSVAPTMGATASMKAVTSAVLAGLSDIPTAAVGATLIGVLENLGILIVEASMRDVIAFVFLIIVLLIFPSGLQLKRRK